MLIVFSQVCILLFFAVVGYVLSKTGLVDSKHAKLLSTLLVYVFLPCLTLKTFALNLNIDYVKSNYTLLMDSTVIFVILAVVMFFGAKLFTKHSYERHIFYYSLLVPNYGYFTYVLAERLYGPEMLLDMMVFALPANIFVYTIGLCILTKTPFGIKNMFKQPAIITMVIGAVLGLMQIQLPDTVVTILENGSACMSPIAMLLTGMVISEYDFKTLLTNKKTYLLVVLRLLVIPIVLVLVLKPFVSEQIIMAIVLLYAMPCGLNTVVFPRLVNENCKIGASLAFISSILAVVTIPLMIHFLI